MFDDKEDSKDSDFSIKNSNYSEEANEDNDSEIEKS